MNVMTNGTRWRETAAGIVAVRGKRELYLLGTSTEGMRKARALLAEHSFDALFRRAARHPIGRNAAYIRTDARHA